MRELTAAVAEPARPWVHHGATSQDVLDTALSLVAVRAAGPLLRHLADAADAAARLARTHRDTLMAARTLGQQAAPTTFGLKAAGWLVGLVEARTRLTRACADLPAQLGGAVGTLAGYGAAGPVMVDRFAAHLGLAVSPLPWHTRRQPLLDLAAALGGLLAATGKIALDVGLLAQTEVGEVAEGARSGVAPRRCRTSATRWTRCWSPPWPGAAPGSSARCSPPPARNTSGPPAAGTPNGSPCST
ncbi:lyase family protein [Verrucosispora sioxanthis]|uniref:lyase family protein n=1 Tax=Verrucosispora sioxanthis TaxID=2499994 RepID=UPI002E2B32C6|nr:lyase family protein [Verrucosispora sioxanthis]